MMKWIIIIIIVFLIFLLYYFSDRRDTIKAWIWLGLAAVLAFAGPYIVEIAEKAQIPEEESEEIPAYVEGEDFIDPPSEHEHKIVSIKEENLRPATCTEGGTYEEASYCECGEELKREIITIPALGHDYKKIVMVPSCEENGFIIYKCSRCGDSYAEDYMDALGHEFIDGICSRCGSISPDYEALITSQASELVMVGKYEEAMELVSVAADKIGSEVLESLLKDIQALQEEAAKIVKYTAEKANFAVYNGTIDSNEDEDVYSLTASIDGKYRVELSDMMNGFRVGIFIYDSEGNKVAGGSGLENNTGITSELKEGNDYTVKVKSYSGTGDYTLKMWHQKQMADVSAKEIIYDSIEFTEQRNEYIFVPMIDGVYRFDFFDVANNLRFGLNIYDSLGYKAGGANGIGNKSGITVELAAGEVYKVRVSQYDRSGTYTLAIGKQKPVLDITGQSVVMGRITYTNQKDVYIFVPSQSKEYTFAFQNMMNGFEVGLNVRDSLDYKVGGNNGLGNDSLVKAKLTAGEMYMIYVTQYAGVGDYTIKIS